MAALGLGLRPALLAGFALAQVGEFSFVLARMGVGLGLFDPDRYQLFLAIAVTTMFAAPFLMTAAGPAADRAAATRLGALLGTPPAAAPDGHRCGEATLRSSGMA